MNKWFCFTFFLILIHIQCHPQNINPDSLELIIESSGEDTIKVNALNELSYFHFGSDPEKAIELALEARSLAEQLNFRKGQAYALKNLGLANYIQDNYLMVLEYWQRSLEVYESLGDKEGEANLLNNIGAVYFQQGDDAKAIEYYLQSLQISEEIGSTIRTATAMLNVGTIYFNKEDTHDKAQEYYLRALPLFEELENLDGIGTVTVNLGEIYYQKGHYDSAIYYYNKSVDAYDGLTGEAYSLTKLAEVHAEKEEYEEALGDLEHAYQIAERFNSKSDMVLALLGTANIYRKMNDIGAAQKYYKEAESIGLLVGANKELKDAFEGLAYTYAEMEDYRNAFKYQSLLTEINLILYNAENDKKIERLQFSYEIDKKQGEIDLLTKDKELQELIIQKQKTVKNTFLAGLILILIIAFILYRNYRTKVKINMLLDKQKTEIQNLLLNILPAEVASELQQSGVATPRYYENASILFTDFKGFTQIAEGLPPNELVAELNDFFMAFDDICEKHNMEKIKTIGDAYMCAGGIPSENSTHPYDAVQAGLAMQEYMRVTNEERMKNGLGTWDLRIGVHTGPIVAGVVGKKKYAYDIWGNSVNIASRMESSGEPGRLNISAATFEKIKDRFECQCRGKVYAKNVGDIYMYFVDGEKVAAMETG